MTAETKMPAPMPDASASPPSPEDADIRARLMEAGLYEFARLGFGGARLERIAARADCAKRMIYYYFGDKEGFYLAVLNAAYSGIRGSEARLDLDGMEPLAALHLLATNSFDYHDRHIDFTRLVLVENLQDGMMMKRLGKEAARLRAAALAPLARLLLRGAEAGVFRKGLNPADVHYLISSLSAFRIDHSGTWKMLLDVDLTAPDVRARHLALLLNALDAMVCQPAR